MQLPLPSVTTRPGTTPPLTTSPATTGILPSGTAPTSVHRPVASLPPIPNRLPNLIPNHELYAGIAAAHLHQVHLPQVPPALAAQAAQAGSGISPVVRTSAAAAAAAAVQTQGVRCTRTLSTGLDGLAGMAGVGDTDSMGGMGCVGGTGGMGEDELLVEAAAWLAEHGGLEALDWLPDLPLTRPFVSRRKGRIDATRDAEGGSGDRERSVDEKAVATAADDASDKRRRVSVESDFNGAANDEAGSIGDAARRIWDVSGRDLVQVALEASRATDGSRFLAPCGVRRELPLLVYLPGLDGTGVFLERHLEGLKPCYDVRSLCIPAADASSYAQLAHLYVLSFTA
ncbi:unnamed protein product, partial [Closterium sp. Naga37s-1]